MHGFADINRHPSPRDLRSLRLVLLAGGLVVASLLRLAAGRAQAAVTVAAVLAAIAALSLVPGLGRLLYLAWMGLGVAVGMVTGPIVLLVVWLVVVTPTALISRLAGRDPLRKRPDPARPTAWEPVPPPRDAASYFRQF